MLRGFLCVQSNGALKSHPRLFDGIKFGNMICIIVLYSVCPCVLEQAAAIVFCTSCLTLSLPDTNGEVFRPFGELENSCSCTFEFRIFLNLPNLKIQMERLVELLD